MTQRRKLHSQLPMLLGTSHGPHTRRDAQSAKRLQKNTIAGVEDSTVQEKEGHQQTTGGRGPEGRGHRLWSGSKEFGRAARGQHARICRALRFQISRVMLG